MTSELNVQHSVDNNSQNVIEQIVSKIDHQEYDDALLELDSKPEYATNPDMLYLKQIVLIYKRLFFEAFQTFILELVALNADTVNWDLPASDIRREMLYEYYLSDSNSSEKPINPTGFNIEIIPNIIKDKYIFLHKNSLSALLQASNEDPYNTIIHLMIPIFLLSDDDCLEALHIVYKSLELEGVQSHNQSLMVSILERLMKNNKSDIVYNEYKKYVAMSKGMPYERLSNVMELWFEDGDIFDSDYETKMDIEHENDAQYFAKRAQLLFGNQKTDAALKAINQAILIEDSEENRIAKWSFLVSLKRYDEAIEVISDSNIAQPSLTCLKQRYETLFILSRYDEALLNAEIIIESNRSYEGYIFKLRCLYMKSGYSEALVYFNLLSEKYIAIKDQFDYCFPYSLWILSKAFGLEYSNYENDFVQLFTSLSNIEKGEVFGINTFKSVICKLPDKEIESLFNSPLVTIEAKLLYCLEYNEYDKAKALLTNDSVLADDKKLFYRVLYLLNTNDFLSIQNSDIESIIKLPKELSERLINTMWQKGAYNHLYSIFTLSKPISELFKWYYFWSIIESTNNVDMAKNVVRDFSVQNLINEHKEVQPLVYKDSNSLVIENQLKLDSVSKLFKQELPYDSLDWDTFCLLMHRVYPDYFSKKIEYAIRSVETEWETDENKKNQTNQFGIEYKELSRKRDLIDKLSGTTLNLSIEYATFTLGFTETLTTSLNNRMQALVFKAKEEERNRIMSNLSHSIKNVLSGVINPLENLKHDFPEQTVVLNNALRGAKLIGSIVTAINGSMNTTIDDVVFDIQHTKPNSITLEILIINSLKNAIGNMFDAENFRSFYKNYFPDSMADELFSEINTTWKRISQSDSQDELLGFANKYMFQCQVEIDKSGLYQIGDSKDSATKLLMFWQEVILNAVKYTSYTPPKERSVSISLKTADGNLCFTVTNTYMPNLDVKSTGVGSFIIKNYAAGFGCQDIEPIKTDKDYIVKIEFKDYWRENGKDTVH